jgi:photosystem II stability/assembly factor-like uncharacterized protein
MKNPKKLLLLIFFLLVNCTLIIHNSSAQWISQYPNTPGVALRDIEFINRYTGWACGDGGLILNTTNGGKNWISQPNPATGKRLISIHPVDSQVAYCVGFFQTILKTTNGGEKWIAIRNGKVGSSGSFEGVFFIDANTGWICGSLGRILKTTDGGITFDSTGVFWGYMKDVYFKDDNTGLIAAAFAGIFKTTDGGLSWEQKYIPYHGGIGDFRKLSVINDQYVYVVEDGKRVFKSTDFGSTWDSIGFVYGADQPFSCGFASEQVGFVGGNLGQMFKTTDSGATWRMENNNGDNRFVISFWFYDELTGWAVGGSTKLFYTETGGLTDVKQISINIPEGFNLYQNYPNPFNSKTTIKFDISNTGNFKLEIFDALGKKIDEIFNKYFSPGSYEVSYDAELLTTGIYFYTLSHGDKRLSNKFILTK